MTIMPLSIENKSVGNPATFQALIMTGCPSIALNWKSLEHIISFSLISSTQSLICWLLYSIVNGPKYAIIPELINKSPVTKCFY